MLLEVKVGAVSKAVEFRGSKGEIVDEVDGPFGIVGKLLFRVLFFVNVVGVEADEFAPLVHLGKPVLKGFFPGRFADEIFDFHLFEFDDAEDEVAGGDLVAERLADLRHAEWDADAHGVDDVFEVEEDRLSGFWA